jgi:signal transduction histidine kinase
MRDSTDHAQQPVTEGRLGDDEVLLSSTSAPSRDRVLLLVAHRRNRTLLDEWFASQSTYDAIDGMARLASSDAARDAGGWPSGTDPSTDGETSESETPVEPAGSPDGLGSEPIDLVLVDVTGLEEHGAWLRHRLELEQPLPLPCLLLASESTARRFFVPGAAHGWHTLVDDVVTTPVEPTLLDRRLRAYLRLREMATVLERRHDQLSLLAQVVRHDIANAVTVVTGWGELLREDVEPDGVEALERVLRGGQRITEIVENSRDLTMLIDADHDLETEAMLLGPVLQMEIDAVRRVHSSTTKQVVVSHQGPLPVVEVVAGGMLPSVFANLLSNAVRHTDSECVEIELSVTVEQHEVVVRVADNGPGIPDDQKTQVFEPSTKRGDSPGDGLGLSLVKRLVESYGGRTWFEDGPEGGAVACVALRRAS